MSELLKECPALGESAGLKNTSLLGASSTKNISQKIDATLAKKLPARVIEAKRELLRDFAHEAATQAADNATILAAFIAMDDAAGMKYSGAKFVTFAREAARATRELLSGGGQ